MDLRPSGSAPELSRLEGRRAGANALAGAANLACGHGAYRVHTSEICAAILLGMTWNI